MLPENILAALKIFYQKIQNQNILWILSGSTSLVLQGVDVTVNNDLDILADKKGALAIDRILQKYRIQKPNYSQTEKYKSHFGIYKIGDIKVEVMGEFQYRLKNGSWSKPNHLHPFLTQEFQGMKLPILSLKQELKEYQHTGKEQTAGKIQEKISKQGRL